MRQRTLLVDADIVAYKFASATEQVFHFDGKDAEPCVASDLSEAIKAADGYLDELADKLKATAVIICLTDPVNFRHQIWPDYKGNRKGTRKPVNLGPLKEHFKANHKTYQRPGLEADDCMGILATHPTLVPGERVIVSEDKDMQTIPGLLFNPAKDETPRKVTPLDADRFHLWQTIVGDQSDGYPGAPGVGPKSPEAQAVLESKSAAEAWPHVLEAFKRSKLAAGLDPATEAVRQARLARILRANDWDFQLRVPRLWIPPRRPS